MALPAPRTHAAPTATVLNLQRMSTEDGPGLRTTVFFKGCPLACTWCHNPESISPRPQPVWHADRCIGCGSCADACPQQALALLADGVHRDRDRCAGCGACAEACPTRAQELLGRRWSLHDLVEEAVKDRAWFGDEGGVTVSGGEPTAQPAFVAAFLAALRAEGIHTAVDTCGLAGPDAFDRVVGEADLVLFDLKLMDPEAHARHTGYDNRRILENLRRLASGMRAGGPPRRLWIRTPLIPGVTDGRENLLAVGAFVETELAGLVERWELCGFNDLCRDQYARLGRPWTFEGSRPYRARELEQLAGVARRSGVAPERVVATGPTRVEG